MFSRFMLADLIKQNLEKAKRIEEENERKSQEFEKQSQAMRREMEKDRKLFFPDD